MLALRAFHEGGQVNIEIVDDGRGIDIARVKAKALQNGIIDAERAARISDREALALIFLPGFSTAEQVTNVSGRGVGMDVVRSNIERTGGSIDIQSEPGQGTTVRLKIPLTLAIIPALIVSAGAERFAIPQMNLVELVRIERGKGSGGVEMLCGCPVYRLRGRLLPLVALATELQLGGAAEVADADREITNIVVLQSDGHEFGLIVDTVHDTEEIVVKPLGKQLKNVTTYAGATIMGDGRVALILDVQGIAQRSAVITEAKDRLDLGREAKADAAATDVEELLLFSVGDGHRMAVPLKSTTRLEEVHVDRIERAGRTEVMQYRGSLLPLVRVAELLGERGSVPRDGTLHVIVASMDGREAGLIVEQIDDIVQERLVIRRDAAEAGILGSAVVNGRVTDFLDVSAILRRVAAAPIATAA
jgi:two-component system chemotaxis sensor kinase CheA